MPLRKLKKYHWWNQWWARDGVEQRAYHAKVFNAYKE